MLKNCREVCSTPRVSKSSLYQMLKDDAQLRQSLYIGNSPRWRSIDVESWIDAKEQSYKFELED
jgi:predicted DNA-binding transcriptional regulator AlpA